MAAVQLASIYPGTFESSGTRFRDKRVGVAVSHDGGETFGITVDPPGGGSEYTSDPVVRVAGDGTFWLVRASFGGDGKTGTGALLPGALVRSSDHGESWSIMADMLDWLDKPWIAIDDRDQTIYVAGSPGLKKRLTSPVSSAPGLQLIVGMEHCRLRGNMLLSQ